MEAGLEALRRLHQFVVRQVIERMLNLRVLEHRLQLAPNRIFAVVLRQQLGNLLAEFVRRPSQVRFQKLTDVHTGRHTQRIQNNLCRSSIRHVRHVFFRQNARDHALVAVASGHLVADAQLALHGDVYLHQLDHAWRQFVTLLQLVFLLVDDLLQHIDLARGHFLDLVDLLVHSRILIRVFNALQVARRNALNCLAVKNVALAQQALVGALVVQVGLNFLPAQQRIETLQTLVGQNTDFIGKVLVELPNLLAFDHLGAFVFLLTLTGEDLHIDDDAFDSRRARQRSVANVSGLFAEDRAQQLLFRRELGFTLRRNFAHQNVARFDGSADANDAAFIEIPQRRLAHVGDIPSDFLRPQLGVARFDFEFLDVDRSVVIVAYQLFRNENRIFEVVSAPWHEG